MWAILYDMADRKVIKWIRVLGPSMGHIMPYKKAEYMNN